MWTLFELLSCDDWFFLSMALEFKRQYNYTGVFEETPFPQIISAQGEVLKKRRDTVRFTKQGCKEIKSIAPRFGHLKIKQSSSSSSYRTWCHQMRFRVCKNAENTFAAESPSEL